MLWDIFAAAVGGGVTAKLAGGDAKIGALAKAIPQIIGSAADAPSLFRRGAFDLAGRIRNAVSAVEPIPGILSRFLTERKNRLSGFGVAVTWDEGQSRDQSCARIALWAHLESRFVEFC